MGFVPIRHDGKTLLIHSATSAPDFTASTVLSGDPWEYVELWMRRQDNAEAVFYWDQAKQFYLASTSLPETASPLTSYYCFLNASKALLEVKRQSYSPHHGVSGDTRSGNTSLRNEVAGFKTSGVLAELCRLLGDPLAPDDEYSLYEMLYHIPFIHRAFQLTYKSARELFIPLQKAYFVRKEGSTEAWFVGKPNPRYVNTATSRMLPSGYEKDEGVDEYFLARKKGRFAWDNSKPKDSLDELAKWSAPSG